jgi:MEDS: MEthanogen/methylotroph, DcmR Sensory domain
MGLGISPARGSAAASTRSCQLLVRRQDGSSEVLQFIAQGLEIGQQVVALAEANYLKHVARALSESGLQPQSLLRSGRLVFLTAPDCLGQIFKPDGLLQRPPLRRQGPMLRWVSDWSWAYSNGRQPSILLNYQRRVHELARSLDALCLCTVHSGALERRALLAILADHRQAAKSPA